MVCIFFVRNKLNTTEWSLLESIFSSENKNPSSETQGPNFVLINILQVIMDTQICQDLKTCGMPTRCKKKKPVKIYKYPGE